MIRILVDSSGTFNFSRNGGNKSAVVILLSYTQQLLHKVPDLGTLDFESPATAAYSAFAQAELPSSAHAAAHVSTSQATGYSRPGNA